MSAGWQVTIIGSTFTKVRYVGAPSTDRVR